MPLNMPPGPDITNILLGLLGLKVETTPGACARASADGPAALSPNPSKPSKPPTPCVRLETLLAESAVDSRLPLSERISCPGALFELPCRFF